MALAATPLVPIGDAANPQAARGNMWSQFFTLVFSGSYATGGEAWDPLPAFPHGAGQVVLIDVAGGAGYSFEYDKTAKKLKLFSAANTELAAGAYNAALTGDVNIVAEVVAK